MTFPRTLLCGAALAALLAPVALAQETAPAEEATPTTDAAPADPGTVVATVNGIDITLGHMIVMRARLPDQYQQLPDDVLFTGILDQLIQQIAVAGNLDGPLSRGSELALENERRAFLAGEALSTVADEAVTDEAIQKLYDERFASAEPTKEFNASHILVETEEQAKEIKAEIDGGADFATVAQAQSTGPSGPNGGDLGWFAAGMMVPPFEEAVMALDPGQVSDPVQTQFGWHVIRLNETRMTSAPPLEEVRGELEQEVQSQAVDAAIAEATASAEIVRAETEIDPAVLKNLDLLME